MNQPALPAFLQNRTSPRLAEQTASHLGTGAPPYLSIANTRLTLVDTAGAEEPVETYDPKLGPYLDCIIVDALERMSKIYYNKPYDPNSSQYEPPACWSDNGIAPSRNASQPQSRSCAECPWSAWGSKQSAVSGKGVKACSDYQKLALMIPGDDVIFLLRIPPNSLSELRNYLNKFNGQQIDVSDVLTRISFVPGSIGTLHFDAVQYIDEVSFKRREELRATKKTDMLVGRTDMPRDAALPPPNQGQQPAQLTAPAAAPSTAAPATTSFVPPQGAPAVTMPAQPAVTVITAPTPNMPAQQAQPPKQRRQRRTAQPEQAAPPQQGQPAMAPFRPEAAQPTLPMAAPGPGNGGMQQPAQADPALTSMLDSVFAKS